MIIDHHKTYSWLSAAILILFSVIAVARIVATYSVFNQTWDEPVGLASGLEWLQQGTYTYEDVHPPLARIAMAIGPYIRGVRLNSRDVDPEVLVAGGNAALAGNGDYLHNLALARMGMLPFFLLGIWVVWYWTRDLFGNAASLVATGLFSILPPILAHAGVAALDLPLTATFALALFAFTVWLNSPTSKHSLFLGLTVGLAVLSKFSALVFLPACCAAALLCWLFGGGVASSKRRQEINFRLKSLGLAVLVFAGLVLVCYRFSFHPVTGPASRPHIFLDHLFGHQGKWHDLSYKVVEETPVPVPEFFHGIKQVKSRLDYVTKMYLLGQVQTTGWWYFYPVALSVKTPIAFLILMVIGAFGTIEEWKRRKDWQVLVPLAGAIALVLVCLPTKLNIGLRYILPIYPLLSILAGLGIMGLWNAARARWVGRIMAVGLAAWMLVSTTKAHPDYLAYFNEFAGNHPERILVDSDLDWGQDLLRLREVLRARGVEHFAIAYNGSTDLNLMNLPQFEILTPCVRTSGWIAISLYNLQMSKPSIGCGGFSWLEAYEPVTLAGKSIRLYWIPNFGETRPPSRSVGVFHSPLATGGQDAYARDHSGAFEPLSFKPEPYTEGE